MRHREPDSHPSKREFPAGHLQLDLLGTFCLRQGGQPVAGLDHPRLQHLLAYLALHRAGPISRQQLAFLFWPGSTDQQAFKNLRTLLTRLRQALPDVERFIDITSQTIQWRFDANLRLDVAELEAALMQVAAPAHEGGNYAEVVEALSSAVAAYTGELVPGCYEDWILPARERLHVGYSEALERLVLLLEEHREYGRALPYARRLLSHDPFHEAAYHHLIRLHLALGDRAEALRACHACETMLEREFGAVVARGTRDLYERLLRSEDQPTLAALERLPGASSTSLPLVGRDAEWSQLLSAWRASTAGHPQLVLISGDAGIGKTRLAEELCAWVARQGTAVAAAHCYPITGSAVAYAPVVEWLRGRAIQSRLANLEDVWLVEIARIFPTLLADHAHLTPPGPFTEAWQRTRLFEALAHAVLGPEAAAQVHEPLLLFLDDLQWCDQETLDWLGYLLRFAAKAPLLIVAAVRKYEIDRVHPLMAFWYALTRSDLLVEIPLPPLNAAETRLLAAKVAGRAVDAGEAARIYHDTEGNPLFVVEMVRSGWANEEPGQGKNQWLHETSVEQPGESGKNLPTPIPFPSAITAFPPKVRAVIQWRLAQLSPAARSLAQIAAVIGRQFRFEVLARTSGQDEESIVQSLDELWQHHIVRAQALEELHQDDLDAFCIQIAGHYEQAGQVQQAVTFYRRAAAAAERVYANAAAARLYQHLLESDLNTALTRSEKCAVMLALAEIWRATGQWAQAETIIRSALPKAEAMGDPRLLARAKCALADVLYQLGYYDAAMQWLAEAEQGFQAAGEYRGLAGTLRIAGKIYWLRGNHIQALAALERQLEMAAEIDDPHGICQAQEAIGTVLWSQGDWGQAADYCLKSIQIAGPLDYRPILTRSSITLGNIRSGEHWFGEAVYWYRYAGTLARKMDDRQALSWTVYNIAQILARRGDAVRASAGFIRSLRAAWEIGDRWTACLNVAGLAAVHERLRKVNEAESLYRLAITIGRRLSIPTYLSGILIKLAQFLLSQERADQAHTIYDEALAQISGVSGERMAGEDTRFDAQVLGIRLKYALGEWSGAKAAAEIRAMLPCANTSPRQAALYYVLWHLAPGDEVARTTAAGLYQKEYAETWVDDCRQRYQELTRENLPDPPPLPDISDFIPDQGDNMGLETVLAQLRSSFG